MPIDDIAEGVEFCVRPRNLQMQASPWRFLVDMGAFQHFSMFLHVTLF